MELRAGYKQSEVGVIPEDWEVQPISDFATVSSGGTPSRQISRYWDGNIPWITTTQIDYGEITEALESITREGLNSSAAKVFPAGTLLMAMYGQGKTRGKIARLKIPAAVNQACAAIEIKHSISEEYIYFNLASRYKEIRNLSNTGNQENLNSNLIRNISLAIPSRDEQRAIATALSDVDALLDSLEQLIAKKRDLKQAAMQQLLTGQQRLEGFSEAWEVKRLGDVGTFLKGSGVRKDESRSGQLPCIRYGEIYTHHKDYIKTFNSWISREVASGATQLKAGDILFAGSGETKEEIGKCVAFVDDFPAYAGGDIVILRPARVDSMFLGYYCNTPSISYQKASKGQGDAVVHISASALSSIEVTLPPLLEQQAIATILSDMDAEIAALEARRDKTKALKHGMMQELLTGKTRLV